MTAGEQLDIMLDHLSGVAREELLCSPLEEHLWAS